MENTIKTRVIKRNGEEVGFDLTKIVNAIAKANPGGGSASSDE